MATTDIAAVARDQAENINVAAIARGFATVGSGTLLATFFNVLLTFLVPRLVSVEDYGYWRVFMLYIGYGGLLHLGLADGALVCWSGRPLEDFRDEILPLLKFLFWQHIAIIPIVALVIGTVVRPQLSFVGIAVLVFTLLYNAITLLQFALQSSRNFTPVAVSMAGPFGIFAVLVFLWELKGAPDFRVLILLYFGAWSLALVYLFARLKPQFVGNPTRSVWEVGKVYLSVGWPIVLANIGLTIVQSADRLVITWAASIKDFAMYSLAASSTMTVVLAIVSAVFRVFFPHLASLEGEQHRRVYVIASRFLFLCWSLLLPCYFVLEIFVRRVLPQYAGSLPVAFFLLIGTVFLGAITILHASFFCLYRRQRAFLWSTVGAIVLSFLIAGAAILGTHSIRIVAVGEIVTLALWWAWNEWKLRDITGQNGKEWALVLGLFFWAAISYVIAFKQAQALFPRVFIYYGLMAGAVWLACPAELRSRLGSLESSRAK